MESYPKETTVQAFDSYLVLPRLVPAATSQEVYDWCSVIVTGKP